MPAVLDRTLGLLEVQPSDKERRRLRAFWPRSSEALDWVAKGLSLGFEAQPSAVRVSRWASAIPQYRPHHGPTIAAAERSLPAGIALAGASYHGIGIPACIRSAQQAAASVLMR